MRLQQHVGTKHMHACVCQNIMKSNSTLVQKCWTLTGVIAPTVETQSWACREADPVWYRGSSSLACGLLGLARFSTTLPLGWNRPNSLEKLRRISHRHCVIACSIAGVCANGETKSTGNLWGWFVSFSPKDSNFGVCFALGAICNTWRYTWEPFATAEWNSSMVQLRFLTRVSSTPEWVIRLHHGRLPPTSLADGFVDRAYVLIDAAWCQTNIPINFVFHVGSRPLNGCGALYRLWD